MAIIKGRAMLLRIATVAIDNQMECSFDVQRDVSETTTKQSAAQWKTFMEDFIGATASISGLIDAAVGTEGTEDIFADLVAGAPATFLFSTGTASDVTYSMSGIYTGLTMNYPKDGPGNFSCTIQVTGAITQGTVGA